MINIEIKMSSAGQISSRLFGDDVGLFLAETWAKIFTKYTPKDSGTLSQSYTIEPYRVTYEQHYSHYQWEGVSKKGNPLNYNKEKNFLAQSHWEQAALRDKKDEVTKAVTEYIKRKG